VDPATVLSLFDDAFSAQLRALSAMPAERRRDRTDVPGQYALDLVADDAICAVLVPAGVRIVSEESGMSGPTDAPLTVVVDPVDGSTNCSRDLPYWGISLAAIDDEGLLCALVTNGATGVRNTAIRGEGAWRDGRRLRAAPTTRLDRSVVGVAQLPSRHWGWRQFRALGSVALGLCDLAAGGIDAWVELADAIAPWDYLGGLLVAREAGAVVADALGRELVVTDPEVRRCLRGAATPELAAEIEAAVGQ
jgi:myo-inositol-1(or 4)-monophosphatase